MSDTATTLANFAEQQALGLTCKSYVTTDGAIRFCCFFPDTYTCYGTAGGKLLWQARGYGATVESAMSAYADQIQGQVLIVGREQRRVNVPKILGLGDVQV